MTDEEQYRAIFKRYNELNREAIRWVIYMSVICVGGGMSTDFVHWSVGVLCLAMCGLCGWKLNRLGDETLREYRKADELSWKVFIEAVARIKP